MTLVLQERDVWSADGSGSSTATTKNSDATSGTVGQHAKDVKARRLITSGLTDDHVCHVMECSTSKEMWSALQKRNERSGTGNKLFLRRRFFNIQMDNNRGMLSHISKVELLSRQLQAAGSPAEESELIMTLLSSLSKK